MDDLTKRWKELSLFEVEGNKVDLSKKRKTGEHVVATKFLTRRNINVEVVACTFRPLWRTRANSEVNDIGNNMVLFDFELNVDAEKVLMGERSDMTDLIQSKICNSIQLLSGFKYMGSLSRS